MNTNKPKNYLILIILAAIFIIPLVSAVLLYRSSLASHLGTSNYGELLSPPIPVENFILHPIDEDLSNPKHPLSQKDVQKDLYGKWGVVLISHNECSQDECKARLHELRQMKKALGKDATRVVISLGTYKTESKKEGSLYIYDPHGNIILYYLDNITTQDLMKDLKKLLKISQIG